jgi:hypothetical protein
MSVSWSRRARARLRSRTPLAEGARRTAKLLFVGLVSIGCTSMLGIDGEYVEGVNGAHAGGAGGRVSASGGKGGDGGGVVETGGTSSGGDGSGGVANGGTGGTASGGAAAGCGTSGACGSGEKCCAPPTGGTPVCVPPAPIFGCGPDSCDPCLVPTTNGVAVCNGDSCGIQCNEGYAASAAGDQCDPVAAGGAGGGGATGTGGTPTPKCTVPTCTNQCFPLGLFKCCRNNNTCGCTWAPPLCY